MKTTTLFALVAAATLGYAGDAGDDGGSSGSAPDYNANPSPAPPSYDDTTPSYDNSWPSSKGGRFGGNSWGSGGGGSGGGDNGGGSGGGDNGGGDGWYGTCDECQPAPPGYATPPKHIRWPTNPNDFPPGSPFKNNFQNIGNKCSSVNNAAACCNKAGTSDGGDENGGGGLLGGLLNGLLSGGPTCTLDILSSLCSSGSVACCPVQDSGNGFSLINVQGVCAPITL